MAISVKLSAKMKERIILLDDMCPLDKRIKRAWIKSNMYIRQHGHAILNCHSHYTPISNNEKRQFDEHMILRLQQ